MSTSENRKSQYKFPSNADADKMKDSYDWGLNVGNAIEGRWFAKESNTSQFYVNRNRYHTLRLYAKGDQDIRRYKDEFSINGDLSYLNLDWKPVPIITKFVDIVVNGMQDRNFSIMANAVDPTSVATRKKYIETLRAEMDNKVELLALQQASGVDIFENKSDNLPGSEEELQLHLELDYKQGVEIAIENAIKYELELNEFDNIKYRFNYDLTSIGIGAVKHQFIPGEGIKIDYVDPANLVYSDTDSMFYDDVNYFGEVKRVHVNELQKQFPSMSADEVILLENTGGSIADNYNATPYNRDQGDEGYIDVIYFCYKTIHNEIYKIQETKLGTSRALEKDINFKPPADKRTGFDKSARSNEVIYEGIKVVGKDILLKWELQKNMVRPNLQSPKVIMPYIVASPKQYKGKIYSLVNRMEKYADAIQIIHLKIQQVIQRMTPSGVFLDVDGLAQVDLGNGTKYNPQEALDMYMQTGSVIGRSLTDEGEFNHGRIPIQELPGSQGAQLQPLLTAYEYNIQQIRNVTGLNEARDGSSPDPNALVGVQKLAALNSNTATRHILQASEYLVKRLSEGLSLRIADVLEYSPTKNDYINAIGKYNVDILDDLKDLGAHEFGIFIELGPDEEAKAKLEANIQASIARGELKIEDAVDIERVTNLKLAMQMLKLKRKQREQIEQDLNQQNIQAQADANTQSAQASEQAKMQAAQILAETSIQEKQAETQFRIQEMTVEKDLEKELLFIKHNLQLDLINIQGSQNLTKQHLQGIQQSQMQQQKLASEGVGGSALGGPTPVGIDNKANTVDGKLKSGGLIQS